MNRMINATTVNWKTNTIIVNGKINAVVVNWKSDVIVMNGKMSSVPMNVKVNGVIMKVVIYGIIANGRHFSNDGKGNTCYAWHHNAGSHSYSAGRDGKAGPSPLQETSYCPMLHGSPPPAPPIIPTAMVPQCGAMPLKSWYCINISPIPEKHDQDPQRCTDIRASPVIIRVPRTICFSHSNLWPANELTSVETMVWEQPIQNFMGLVDVYYIDQVYAHAQSEIKLKELLDVSPPPLAMASSLGELFLDYQRHPPIPVNKAKLVARKMDIVDILVSWYSAQLTSAPPGSITLWMR
ncbi:hypothetical protein BS47DRAFT_1368126 [Hydnum rufescens UP504]|uniref:Uncharacterized protein n=1 Tax=Hydnum rufescens UP504 TaxID=1448309 RepID=A0A9P6AGM5_9AGAM|nr:hypothetical protein BS47DRAFT_1368126 [Hydnum rufescens UP504]